MSEEKKETKGEKVETETIPDSVEAYLGSTPWWRPRTRKIKVRILDFDPKTRLEIEVDGETHTLLQPLQVELLRLPQVKFAAYRVTHPLEEKAHFIVITDGSIDPVSAIKQALNRVREKLFALKDALVSALRSGATSTESQK